MIFVFDCGAKIEKPFGSFTRGVNLKSKRPIACYISVKEIFAFYETISKFDNSHRWLERYINNDVRKLLDHRYGRHVYFALPESSTK